MTHLPRPTVWPAALATGATLLAAGIVTHWVVSLAGAVLALIALVGWVELLVSEER
jgi:hypothetical protein